MECGKKERKKKKTGTTGARVNRAGGKERENKERKRYVDRKRK